MRKVKTKTSIKPVLMQNDKFFCTFRQPFTFFVLLDILSFREKAPLINVLVQYILLCLPQRI